MSPALIDAARQWPLTKNSNGQRRGGAALKNKSTRVPGWRPLLINIPSRRHNIINVCCIIKASSAHHTTTKGGPYPNHERSKLIGPSTTLKISDGTPPHPDYYCACRSRQGFVPLVPNGHNNKRVNAGVDCISKGGNTNETTIRTAY